MCTVRHVPCTSPDNLLLIHLSFFPSAGYAKNPEQTIPQAIAVTFCTVSMLALGITVAGSGASTPTTLMQSSAPLMEGIAVVYGKGSTTSNAIDTVIILGAIWQYIYFIIGHTLIPPLLSVDSFCHVFACRPTGQLLLIRHIHLAAGAGHRSSRPAARRARIPPSGARHAHRRLGVLLPGGVHGHGLVCGRVRHFLRPGHSRDSLPHASRSR